MFNLSCKIATNCQFWYSSNLSDRENVVSNMIYKIFPKI